MIFRFWLLVFAGFRFGYCDVQFYKVGENSYYIGSVDLNGTYFDWFTARDNCRAHSSQLVALETAEELSHLQDYIISKGYSNGSTFATSGHSFKSEYPYAWDSVGRTLEYTKWLPGEKLPLEQSYLSLALIDSELYMIRSEGYDKYYICEPLSLWDKISLQMNDQFSKGVLIAVIFLIICYTILICIIIQKRLKKSKDREPLLNESGKSSEYIV